MEKKRNRKRKHSLEIAVKLWNSNIRKIPDGMGIIYIAHASLSSKENFLPRAGDIFRVDRQLRSPFHKSVNYLHPAMNLQESLAFDKFLL